jgi:hypothetical protein
MFFKYLGKKIFVLYTTHYVATQQLTLKEKTMFKIEDQYKSYEQAVERVIQITEFWFHSIISTAKSFYKIK